MSSANATYIRVHKDGDDLSSGGDSGGPWFLSGTAYGIHKCGIGTDSCYTIYYPTSNLPETFHKFSASAGFVCRNQDQGDNYCNDYEVQFYCN